MLSVAMRRDDRVQAHPRTLKKKRKPCCSYFRLGLLSVTLRAWVFRLCRFRSLSSRFRQRAGDQTWNHTAAFGCFSSVFCASLLRINWRKGPLLHVKHRANENPLNKYFLSHRVVYAFIHAASNWCLRSLYFVLVCFFSVENTYPGIVQELQDKPGKKEFVT